MVDDRPDDPAHRRRLRAVLYRTAGPVRPGARMNVLDLVAGLAAAAIFIYLLWALLRPEDF